MLLKWKKKKEEKKPGLKVKLRLVLFGGLWTTVGPVQPLIALIKVKIQKFVVRSCSQ